MKPYFILFDKEVHWYGLLWFFGIFVSALIAVIITDKEKIHRYDIAYSAVYTMIAATIGAKLLFLIVSLEFIIKNNVPFVELFKGGFVFYGGLIGGVIGLWIYCKQFKIHFTTFADFYAVVLPFGHAFGRIGCLISGCCCGLPYDGPLSIEYTHYGAVVLNTPLFPIQLVEAALLVMIFIVLLILYFKKVRCGIVTALYMILYSIMRFILEFFRGDVGRGHLLDISTSQWISLALFIIGIVTLVKSLKTKNEQLIAE